MLNMYRPMLFIFEADTEKSLEVPAAYGPRKIARALGNVFNSGSEDWDPRHMGKVANLIADYTAGEKVEMELIREVRIADLQVVFLAH
jgi:hypothetical protein